MHSCSFTSNKENNQLFTPWYLYLTMDSYDFAIVLAQQRYKAVPGLFSTLICTYNGTDLAVVKLVAQKVSFQKLSVLKI